MGVVPFGVSVYCMLLLCAATIVLCVICLIVERLNGAFLVLVVVIVVEIVMLEC